MNPVTEMEIWELTEQSVIEAMRDKKLKPEKKAKIGMSFLQSCKTIEHQNRIDFIQLAGLFTETNREEIARKIIPPIVKTIDQNTKLLSGKEYDEISRTFQGYKHEIKVLEEKTHIFEEKVNIIEKEKQQLQDKIADFQDEQASKEKSKLVEIIQEEYQQKREINK